MIFRVGACTIDTQTHEVRRSDRSIAVEPQVFDLLVLLLTNRDRLVTKDEIIERIWNGRVVSDATLSSRIRTARQVIGDDGKAQSLIRTVQRRGFRFVGPLTFEHGEKDDAAGAGVFSRLAEDVEVGRPTDARAAPPPTRQPPLLGQPAISAERRHLTVMFCDLLDSTTLSARLDPEDMDEIIRAYQARVADAVTRFGGSIARSGADGVVSYFGWPKAKEEDAEGSVRAALALVAAVAEVPIHGQTRHVRVGIASGPIVLGDATTTVAGGVPAAVGPTPGLAAGLQSLAELD